MAAILTPPRGTGRVIAFIDLGSNSLRLLVARINIQGVVKVLNEAKQMVRLGEGAFIHHHLQPEAMERTLETLRSFADMCQGYGVEEYIAVATAATRDAVNGEEFLAEIRRETGIDFTVISGKEEARLIWRGVASGFEKSDTLRLYLDIGGGSTEIAAASTDAYQVLDSLKIGCVRLANIFPCGEKSVSAKQYEAMQMYVRNEGVHAFRRLADLNIPQIVASSGTAQNLAQITELMNRNSGSNAPDTAQTLTYRGLCRCVKELCSRTRQERAEMPGLNIKRLDVIIPGAAILQTVLEELNFDTVSITSRGLRDGMVTEYVERSCPGALLAPDASIREKSVLGLGRSCRFEEGHSRHVAELTLSLFDSAREVGLHDFSMEVRELLRYAALLHDVGIFITFSNHNVHSHYLISNSELLGFTDREVRFIAALAFFHRAKPSKKHRIFNELELSAREVVKVVSVFLTVAEALDKSHMSAVASARFARQKKKCVLEVLCKMAAPLERGRLMRCEDRLKKLCGNDMQIVFEEPPARHFIAGTGEMPAAE